MTLAISTINLNTTSSSIWEGIYLDALSSFCEDEINNALMWAMDSGSPESIGIDDEGRQAFIQPDGYIFWS